MLSLFPRDVLDEIRDLTESFSDGFPTYLYSLNTDRLGLLLLFMHPKDGQITSKYEQIKFVAPINTPKTRTD